MLEQTIYDAFTKLTLKEKTDIANFLVENKKQYQHKKIQILSAIDAVAKEIPSFGGYIVALSCPKTRAILAVAITNNTGMNDFGFGHIISFYAVEKRHEDLGIEDLLLEKVLSRTTGDTIINIETTKNQSTLSNVGFKTSSNQMLFSKKKTQKKRKHTIPNRVSL